MTKQLSVNGSIDHRATEPKIKSAIRKRLDELGISANEVCRRTGTVNAGHLSRFLGQRDKSMALDLLDDLAFAMGTSIPQMLQDESHTHIDKLTVPALSFRRLPTTARPEDAIAEAGRLATRHMLAPGLSENSIAISIDDKLGLIDAGSVIIVSKIDPEPGDIALMQTDSGYKIAQIAVVDGRKTAITDGRQVNLSGFCGVVTYIIKELST